MDKRLKDYYDGLFSPEEESEVQKWLALHGKDEFVSDSLRELFDGEEKCSGDSTQIPDFVVRWEYENRSSVTQQLNIRHI